LKININNPKELERIILKDDLWKYLILFLIILFVLFYYLKTNPKIIKVQITDIELLDNQQIIKYSYSESNKVLKDSIVNHFNNLNEKQVAEDLSADFEKGSQILIEVDWLTNKYIKRYYEHEDVNHSIVDWIPYLIVFVLFTFIIIALFYLFRNRKNKIYLIMNGEIAIGKYLESKIVSENYTHFYEYQVLNKKYVAKHTTNIDISYPMIQIIYEKTNPENILIIEIQSKRLKDYIFTNNFELDDNIKSVKHQGLKILFPDNERVNNL